MFYPSPFEIKLLKEQEIRERVQRAESDRIVLSIRPRHEPLMSQLLRRLLQSAAQMRLSMSKRADAPRPEFRATRQSNAVQ